VTVQVTPVNLMGSDPTLDFRVVLDTHAVELDYDLTQLAVLRDEGGNLYRPVAWDGPRGGHHLDGVLRFGPRPEILLSGGQYLELELRDIARIPTRVFRWEFTP
jgi:hypothetical protein